MTYSTDADLVTYFGEDEIRQLTDRSMPASGQIDTAVTAAKRQEAFVVINSYVGAAMNPKGGYIYELPLTFTHPLLVKLECDLARSYLYGDHPLEQVTINHDRAMKMLEGIRDGKVSLAMVTVVTETVSIGGPDYVAPARVFTSETLAQY